MIPKFAKMWEGFVTNSFAGRDDGFPETKFTYLEDEDDLVPSYKEGEEAEYFLLIPMEPDALLKAVKGIKDKMKKQEKAALIKRTIKQIDKLMALKADLERRDEEE